MAAAGGHLEPGDPSLAQAALRECVEETGIGALALLDDAPVHLDAHAAPCGADTHLDVRFVVVAPEGAEPSASDESLDVAWFPVDALPATSRADLEPLVGAAVRSARRALGLNPADAGRPG